MTPTSEDPRAYFIRADSTQARALFPGVSIRAIPGDRMMLSLVTFEPETGVPDHSHPHEQMGVLLSGRLEFTIAGHTQVLEPGDFWRIPGGVSHRAKALDGPAVALDVFHPIREDYL